MYVWLAERAYSGPSDILGVFSDDIRAKHACQDSANAYMGERLTSALSWRDYDGHSSASYHHPCNGMWTFMVTRYTVNEETQR